MQLLIISSVGTRYIEERLTSTKTGHLNVISLSPEVLLSPVFEGFLSLLQHIRVVSAAHDIDRLISRLFRQHFFQFISVKRLRSQIFSVEEYPLHRIAPPHPHINSPLHHSNLLSSLLHLLSQILLHFFVGFLKASAVVDSSDLLVEVPFNNPV